MPEGWGFVVGGDPFGVAHYFRPEEPRGMMSLCRDAYVQQVRWQSEIMDSLKCRSCVRLAAMPAAEKRI